MPKRHAGNMQNVRFCQALKTLIDNIEAPTFAAWAELIGKALHNPERAR